MAKGDRPRGARSQAVRDYVTAHPEVRAKDVLAALHEQGVDVSLALISRLKSSVLGRAPRKSKKRKAPRGAAGQAVRHYMSEHPEATAKETREALQAGGLQVSLSLINALRGQRSKLAQPSSHDGESKSQPRLAAAGKTLSAQDLLEAKRLVDALGGLEHVKRALHVLEQLR